MKLIDKPSKKKANKAGAKQQQTPMLEDEPDPGDWIRAVCCILCDSVGLWACGLWLWRYGYAVGL